MSQYNKLGAILGGETGKGVQGLGSLTHTEFKDNLVIYSKIEDERRRSMHLKQSNVTVIVKSNQGWGCSSVEEH